MLLKLITKNKTYDLVQEKYCIEENIKFNNLTIKKALVLEDGYFAKNKLDKIVYKCQQCMGDIIQTYGHAKHKIFNNEYICPSCTRENTCKKLYGVKNGGGSKKSISKMKKHFYRKYGVENPYQAEEVKEKIKQTNLERYGVEHNMQLPTCKEKRIKTYIERYGVENPMHNDKIVEKVQSSMHITYRLKKLEENLHYQTKPELKFIKHCKDKNIPVKDGPSIEYYWHGQKHIYYIDFETDKYLVEIKNSHGWYKEDLISGKIKAKNRAANKFATLNNKKFIFLLDRKDYSFII